MSLTSHTTHRRSTVWQCELEVVHTGECAGSIAPRRLGLIAGELIFSTFLARILFCLFCLFQLLITPHSLFRRDLVNTNWCCCCPVCKDFGCSPYCIVAVGGTPFLSVLLYVLFGVFRAELFSRIRWFCLWKVSNGFMLLYLILAQTRNNTPNVQNTLQVAKIKRRKMFDGRAFILFRT